LRQSSAEASDDRRGGVTDCGVAVALAICHEQKR
jgi:hypothetical protein